MTPINELKATMTEVCMYVVITSYMVLDYNPISTLFIPLLNVEQNDLTFTSTR